jgi:hypothetical protein
MARLFLAYQVPLADSRVFLGAGTGRLTAPRWPSKGRGAGTMLEPGREFVRAVGQVRVRRRGGIAPWVGEDAFADATRALRFPPGIGPWRIPLAEDRYVRFGWAFRRFNSSGPVARVECGLRQTTRDRGEPLDARRLSDLVGACLRKRLEVRTQARAWEPAQLATCDRPLARLLLRSTTARVALRAADPEAWWLEAGRPLAVLEYSAHLDSDGTVPRSRRVETLADWGIQLHHTTLEVAGRPVAAWLLGVGDAANADALRRLRIHLFRLHAEREVLKRILSNVATGRIVHEAGKPHSEALEDYLNDALQTLFRPSSHGVPQREILEVAYRGDELVSEGERATLLPALEQARLNVRRKVEERTDPQRWPLR